MCMTMHWQHCDHSALHAGGRLVERLVSIFTVDPQTGVGLRAGLVDVPRQHAVVGDSMLMLTAAALLAWL